TLPIRARAQGDAAARALQPGPHVRARGKGTVSTEKFYVVTSRWHADRLFAGERKNLKAAIAEMLDACRGPVLVTLWQGSTSPKRTVQRYRGSFFENGYNINGLPELPSDDPKTTFADFEEGAS